MTAREYLDILCGPQDKVPYATALELIDMAHKETLEAMIYSIGNLLEDQKKLLNI